MHKTKLTAKRIKSFISFGLIILTVAYFGVLYYQSQHLSFSDFCDKKIFVKNYSFHGKREEIQKNPKHEYDYHDYLYNGRVLLEFSERVLSRSISQSHVLVVSPEIITTNNGNISSIYTHANNLSNENGPAKTVLSVALQENHTVYALSPRTNLNSWWNDSVTMAVSTKISTPSWILLALFLSENNKSDGSGTIDHLLSPNRIDKLLKEATITYIVFRVKAQWQNGKMTIDGQIAIQSLIDAKYKVQILASSHYCSHGSAENNKYGPNTLLKSSQDLQNMFLSCRHGKGSKTNNALFFVETLLFATQGLDLAIPSRRSYLDLTRKACPWENNERCDVPLDTEELPNLLLLKCPSRHSRVSVEFSTVNEGVNIPTTQIIVYVDKEAVFNIVGNHTVTKIKNSTSPAIIHKIWKGGVDLNHSEAICVAVIIPPAEDEAMLDEKQMSPLVSCTTRILPKSPNPITDYIPNMQPTLYSSSLNKKSVDRLDNRVNVLFVLIDPMSRSQFQRSLPRTAKLLLKLGFINFSHYSVVGDNSGPNQAALFTGEPLQNGRNGIKHSFTTNGKGSSKATRLWLWDRLRDAGYVTLKAEDGCIENSNMIQSMQPLTTHGQQLQQMNCFDFDRPNCIGERLAAQYLTNYSIQFMNQYSRNIPSPWAAFLSFIDGHEDTLTLASLLDNILFDFIQRTLKMSTNTITLVLSDHGLHYGPYFRSIPGERERSEPILFMHLPDSFSETHKQIMVKNSNAWVTPFDVHETIIELTLTKPPPLWENIASNSPFGSSLMQPLPSARNFCHGAPGIPERFCALSTETRRSQIEKTKGKSYNCQFMHNPPSISSFFSDIPRENRPIWPDCKATKTSASIFREFGKRILKSSKCYCSTNKRDWFDCQRDTWKGQNTPPYDTSEYFFLTSCNDDNEEELDIFLTINITRRSDLVERYTSREKPSNVFSKQVNNVVDAASPLPNILFIEVDSVSLMSADRLLPKTQRLLKRLQIEVDIKGKPHCSGLCAALFKKTSIVGKNSIPNQLASMSGCIDANYYNDSDLYLFKEKQNRSFETWCSSKNISNTWIFDVARKSGYVTFFGEEFCYTGSPFVVQNNIFPLDADYSLHEVFCRLASDTIRRKGLKEGSPLWSVEHDWSSNAKPCLKGGQSRQGIAFDTITQIWDSFQDIPKLAFLNALAAHDYSLDSAFQILGAEAYDEHLSSFLETMVNRSDAEKTVIIIRSDHGLQGGPSQLDYSTQIEHMNPWNNLIVPSRYLTVSLAENQNRLVTGFDLYHTLRRLMMPLKSNEDADSKNNPLNGMPKWSYDLIRSTVPTSRSCSDARVPKRFCPCMNERDDLGNYFGVGFAEHISTQ